MKVPRRKCRLAASKYKDVDLRQYSKLIIDTINATVPGKNPVVYKDHFSTDVLTQSEAVSLGRAMARLDELKGYGKTVTIFRLFDGRTCESEESNLPFKGKRRTGKGGRMT